MKYLLLKRPSTRSRFNRHINLSRSVPKLQVERDLGIDHGTVSKWIRDKKKFQDDAFCGSGNVHPSEREFKSLQKELVRTKRELEILKKPECLS